jgi:hypothetical protein
MTYINKYTQQMLAITTKIATATNTIVIALGRPLTISSPFIMASLKHLLSIYLAQEISQIVDRQM